MSYLVFARKYRPQDFDAVVQQTHVTRTLVNAIESGRVAHAILFAGPRGTGKTTVARILAKAMNCEQGPTGKPCGKCRSCLEIQDGHAADVFEIDGASNNSVDQVRDLRDNLKYMPSHSRYKIYIIDEVHMLSLAAFNALLKTLEEPPEHVLFMFATTEAHKIPVTILSRCQRHDLRRIELPAIVSHLKAICDQEAVTIEEESLGLIAQEAGGSLRDALSLLDHVLACAESEVTSELVADLLGAVERRHLFAFSEAVFSRDLQALFEKIDHVWQHGLEIKRFYSDLVAHFHHLLLVKMGTRSSGLVDLPEHEVQQMATQVKSVPEPLLVQLLEMLFQAEQAITFSSQPRMTLELLFIKLFQTPPALSIDRLISGLDQLRTSPSATPKIEAVQLPKKEAVPEGPPPVSSVAAQAEKPVLSQPESSKETNGEKTEAAHRNRADETKVWDLILDRMEEERPSLEAILRKSQIVHKGEDCWEIAVGGNEFSFNSVKKQSRLLKETYLDLTGRELELKLIADGADAATRQEKKKKEDQVKKNALGHPMVMEALEIFNGKIVDVKVP